MAPKKDEQVSLELRDVVAALLLKDFIRDGFPAVDPIKQVDAAYTYAELIVLRRQVDSVTDCRRLDDTSEKE